MSIIKKSIVLLLISILTAVVLGGCNSSNGEYVTPLECAKQTGEDIMRGITNDDIVLLKGLFCDSITEKSNIEQEIELFIDFIQGDVISYDEPAGYRQSKKSTPEQITVEGISGNIENIKTNEGKTYRIAFYYYRVNKEQPEHMGISSIAIMDVDTYDEKKGYPEYGRMNISISD